MIFPALFFYLFAGVCIAAAVMVVASRKPVHSVLFLILAFVNAAALWVATRLVSGVTYTGEPLPFLVVALVFGIVNTFVGTLTKILTFPLIILTLGLFIFVVNGLMLMLTSSLSVALGLGFHVSGFWSAFFGALVVSVVSTLLTTFVRDSSRAYR